MVPLTKASTASDDERYGTHVTGGPTEDLRIPGHEWREFRLPRLRPSYEVWIRRTSRLVPTVTKYRRGQPTWIRLTNITQKPARCARHDAVVFGHTRLTSNNYKDWQVLAYAEGRDVTLFEHIREVGVRTTTTDEQVGVSHIKTYTSEGGLRVEFIGTTVDRPYRSWRANDRYSSPSGVVGRWCKWMRRKKGRSRPPNRGLGRKLDAAYVSVMHEITDEVKTGRPNVRNFVLSEDQSAKLAEALN
ncbi:hypothetical protein PHMEG_0001480 [Phytophthora megakarya]|uniref:Eukaryotic/viral aspartic protease n=1 Tax=Phytophthora megakarya TaxID=4795 RepID=A0A225X302_9STRA|nr:hypothetical protein PHMEG_0001480 [Phytophthora megakarya]